MTRRTPQMFVFSYHKSGTMLFMKVMGRLAHQLGLKIVPVHGMARSVDRDADVVNFTHSLVDFDLDDYDFRGVRVVRDPRDIWLSGYLYHRVCSEPWCTNVDFEISGPIRFPQVPQSQAHRPEVWKQAYLRSLGGRSYQQNLLDLSQPDGLAFELAGYAGWTIESMSLWRPHAAVMDITMEQVSADFDGTMTAVFRHLGLEGDALMRAVAIASSEDVSRMSDRQVEANQHIHSRQLSKWRTMLTEADLERFRARFDGVAEGLGYPA